MFNWIKRLFTKKQPDLALPKIDASALKTARPLMPVPPIARRTKPVNAWEGQVHDRERRKKDAAHAALHGAPYMTPDPYLSQIAAAIGPDVTTWQDLKGNIHWSTKEQPVGDYPSAPSTQQWWGSDLESAKQDASSSSSDNSSSSSLD